jgi:hypothetical protein
MKAANNMLRLTEVRTPMFSMTFSSASFKLNHHWLSLASYGGHKLK